MPKRIAGKPKAKDTDGKPRHNKAMSATSATKPGNGKMYCLSAKCLGRASYGTWQLSA